MTQRELGMFLIQVYSKEQLENELNDMKSKHEQLNPNKEIILDIRPNPGGVKFDGNEAINFYVTISLKLKKKVTTQLIAFYARPREVTASRQYLCELGK